MTTGQRSQAFGGGRFLREFIRSPLRTAAVLPSSASLAAQMTVGVPERGEPVVVELGAGTGAFTAALQRRLGGRGRHVVVELNDRFAAGLSRAHPGVEVVCDDAVHLPRLLAGLGVGPVDVVVSGLPWIAYAGRPPLVESVAGVLSPAGVYTQFAYTWTRWAAPARRLAGDLRSAFEEVVTSTTVWRNVPPAVVYVARRPRVRAAAGDVTGSPRPAVP
ncbi:class I SAM-dependent methyltransferase [Nonomuraea gerenzanensis]|uniref:Ribosomal RNA adenine dimethylase n=1 Tax=Nonomuraea gerenzanensis TaxID=93944 RepID=A0A1M4EAC8_9ACTN|nr:methyltransferase domain-containing protein [Nonomuraea gerenzanensis]UBU17956.1 methyltransferase domain-containing protein [Nonomuraea gerenzanensis]SBO95756.1 Ribosomal RNA adenine dimethylase [Nonomuraea gerenzanensis]